LGTRGEGIGVAAGDGVCAGTGVVEGEGVGNGTGLVVGFGAATSFVPLFHTSFLPLLIHVNFLPLAVAVVPAFLQLSPALTAATAFNGAMKKVTDTMTTSNFFICED
jgi:hypothetical protein